LSLDPAAAEAAAEADAARAASIRHREKRLQAAITALADKHSAVEKEAEQARRRAAYEAAERERDALAEDLRRHYPRLAAELAALLTRVQENDAALARVNSALPSGADHLASAELEARDLKGFESFTPLVRGVRLPGFGRGDALGGRTIWPPPAPLPTFGG
jgi:chromosome segregation ATPase